MLQIAFSLFGKNGGATIPSCGYDLQKRLFQNFRTEGKRSLVWGNGMEPCTQTASETYIRAAQQAGVKCGVKRNAIIICSLRTCSVGRRRSRDWDASSGYHQPELIGMEELFSGITSVI